MKKPICFVLTVLSLFQANWAAAHFILCVGTKKEAPSASASATSSMAMDESFTDRLTFESKGLMKYLRVEGEWKTDKSGNPLVFIAHQSDEAHLKKRCEEMILKLRGDGFRFLKVAASPTDNAQDLRDYPLLYESDYYRGEVLERTRELEAIPPTGRSLVEEVLHVAENWTNSDEYKDVMVDSVLKYIHENPAEAKRLEGYTQIADSEAEAAKQPVIWNSADRTERVKEFLAQYGKFNGKTVKDFVLVTQPFREGSSHGLQRGAFNVFTNLVTDSFKPEEQKRKKSGTVPVFSSADPCHQKAWVLSETLANVLTLKGFLFTSEVLEKKDPDALMALSSNQQTVIGLVHDNLLELAKQMKHQGLSDRVEQLAIHLDDLLHLVFVPKSGI